MTLLVIYVNFGVTVTYKRISDTWNAQMKERQYRILDKITKNVGHQVGLQQLFTSDVAPVANPYNDTLDDLSDSDESEESPIQSPSRTPSIEPKTPLQSQVRFYTNYLSNGI